MAGIYQDSMDIVGIFAAKWTAFIREISNWVQKRMKAL